MAIPRSRLAIPLIAAVLALLVQSSAHAIVRSKKVRRSPSGKKVASSKKTAAKQPVRRTTSIKKARNVRSRYPAIVRVSAAVRSEANGLVSATLDRTTDSITIENPRALVPFFEQLYRARRDPASQPLRILHYGDSHTAADDWTHSLRELLQSQFGDGGGGFSLAGRPFAGYRRWDLQIGASRNWKSEGLLSRDGDGLWGLGGVSINTTRPNESVTLDADCRLLEVFFLQQPGGGSLELADNGATVATFSTGGELGPGYFSAEVTPGPHHFQLRTLDRAPVRLFGWVTEKESGVTYETLGINGAQASIIFRWDAQILAGNLARRNPALIVLAYGTNEAGNSDWTQESYRAMFSALVAKLREAAPAASILVLGPPDRFFRSRGRWLPYERVDRIIAAQREAALESGCAYWDLREKMGGPGAMRQWVLAGLAQGDHVHFTQAGYRRIGQVLFHDLMYNYGRYLKVREELIGQSLPVSPPLPLVHGNPNSDH
ncbi:MAG: SGNH/GDSL hydrolase family protein [Bryobacteraceae bacterium]